MKKIFLFLFCVSVFALTTEAQVTIGSPDAPIEGAVLELKSANQGFVPTRVSLTDLSSPDPISQHVEGMVVYNINPALQIGLYYNDGEKWIKMTSSSVQTKSWFYMPPIVINTEEPSATEVKTIDLYNEFKRQKSDASNTKTISSSGAPQTPFATIPAATDFYYYVVDYDADVFEIDSIATDGTMAYKVKDAATDKTFITIIFVEK